MALILAPISFCKLLASVCTLVDGASSFSRISLAAVAPSSVGLALHAARACLTISKFLLSSEVLPYCAMSAWAVWKSYCSSV